MVANANLLPSLSNLNLHTVPTDGGAAAKRSIGNMEGNAEPSFKPPELSDVDQAKMLNAISSQSPSTIQAAFEKMRTNVIRRLNKRVDDDAKRREATVSLFEPSGVPLAGVPAEPKWKTDMGVVRAYVEEEMKAEHRAKPSRKPMWPAEGASRPQTAKEWDPVNTKVYARMERIVRDLRYNELEKAQSAADRAAGLNPLDFPVADYGLIRKYAQTKSFANVEPNIDAMGEAPRIPGVIVVPILAPDDLNHYRALVEEAMNEFPEFRPPSHFNRTTNVPSSKAGDFKFVAGGFGGLANPSSFHHPTIRELRRLVHSKVLEADRASTALGNKSVFGFWDPSSEHYKRRLEQICDRLMFRRIGDSPMAESWHRDDALGVDPANPATNYPADVIYGGWLNLDEEGQDQHFSCIPYSASAADRRGGGFDKIKSTVYEPTEQGYQTVRVQMLEWMRHMHRIKVPPGHLLIFDEMTVHEVLATEKPHDSLRLFFGWRISGRGMHPVQDKRSMAETVQTLPQVPMQLALRVEEHEDDPPIRPLTWNLEGRIEAQEAMPIKSGQHLAPNHTEIVKSLGSAASQNSDQLRLFQHYSAVYKSAGGKTVYPGGPNFTTDSSWGKNPPNTENGIINVCVKHLNPLLLGIRHFGVDLNNPSDSAQRWENLNARPTANNKAYDQLIAQLDARVDNTDGFAPAYGLASGPLRTLYKKAKEPYGSGGGGVVCTKSPFFDSLKVMSKTTNGQIPKYGDYSLLDLQILRPNDAQEILAVLTPVPGQASSSSDPMRL